MSEEGHQSFEVLGARLRATLQGLSADQAAAFITSEVEDVLRWRLLSLLGTDAEKGCGRLLVAQGGLRLFLCSGEAAGGQWAQALDILNQIFDEDPQANDGIRLRLAVAVALVFAVPVKALADGSHIDALGRYFSYCVWLESGELWPCFEALTAWQMRYVVGSWAHDDELVWARQHLSGAAAAASTAGVHCADLLAAAASAQVPYRVKNSEGVSVHAGAAYYGGRPRTLQLMHEVGGVCGAVSKFASAGCQAFGVPAMPVAQPGHCAFSWWSKPGSWNLGNDNCGWGKSRRHDGIHLTWGSDVWLVPLMEHAQQMWPCFVESECLRVAAVELCGAELRGNLLAASLAACPYNFPSWCALIAELGNLPGDTEGHAMWVEAAWRRLSDEFKSSPRCLSKGKPARASDCQDRAGNVTDGTGSEWWTGADTAWIEVDLVEPCVVSGLRLQWWGYSAARDYSVLSSLNGEDYSLQRVKADELQKPGSCNGWSEVPGWDAQTRFLRLELRYGRKDPWGLGKQLGLRQVVAEGYQSISHDVRAVLKADMWLRLEAHPTAVRHLCKKVDEAADTAAASLRGANCAAS